MRVEQTVADLSISLPLDAYAPRAARHHVALVDRPSPDLRDAVVLLTSEIVSRAVERCQFKGAIVVLRVWMPASVVRVEMQAPRTFLAEQDQSESSDYGLMLVRSLADRWSLAGHGDLARLWFEIDRRQAREQPFLNATRLANSAPSAATMSSSFVGR
ncbi:MAG TPA: hypothetical protein VII03_01290 [Solirubrobacteraceae bacterium]